MVRTANVVVSVVGAAAVVVAVWIAWRWRRLQAGGSHTKHQPWSAAAADAVRTISAVVSAGALSGLLVLGLVGRLVMRVLAATSGRAQGRLTEAGERVGEITLGGTVGFLVFVGLAGGLVTAFAYLLVRRWLPSPAGVAGLVGGLLLVGTLGVLDPLSPDNVDFDILGPTWLAVTLVVATGVLFACTFTALAARLELAAEAPRWTRWLPCVAMPLALLPPFPAATLAYIGGRAVARGRVGEMLDRRVPAAVGRTVLGVLAAVTLAIAVSATAQIATA